MAIDPNEKEKADLEKRLEDILAPIMAAYLLRYRQSIASGQGAPRTDEELLKDLKYSLDRHYRRVQDAFKTKVFSNIDPVEFNSVAQETFNELLDRWREETSEIRAALIARTNELQGQDMLVQAREALQAEQPTVTLTELSLLATALLKPKFDERRKMISVTETQAASESTKQLKTEALESTPVLAQAYAVVRTWNCSFRNSRDSHIGADGQTRPKDQRFLVGSSYMLYPGDISAPAKEVINCHCWLTSTVIPLRSTL